MSAKYSLGLMTGNAKNDGLAELSSMEEAGSVLALVQSAVFGFDEDGRISFVNGTARHFLGGISTATPFDWPNEIVFLDPRTRETLDSLSNPVARVLQGEVLRDESVLMQRNEEGEGLRRVRLSSMGLGRISDGVTSVLVVEESHFENRDRLPTEGFRRLVALGKLTGGIAHDFNNLLTSVLYAISLTKESPDETERENLLSRAEASIVRARALTSRLLAFGQRQSGLETSFSVTSALTEFAAFVRPVIEDTFELHVKVPDEDLFVHCDHSLLETALLNLILNGREAILQSGEGSRIEVRAREVRVSDQELEKRQSERGGMHIDAGTSYRYVAISVSDNGPGMNRETMKRATDPFFTTKPTGSSSGLGLSMVHGFARQSRGDLRLYSEEGLGTTIELVLPRGTKDGHRELPIEDEHTYRGNGETILIAEDEPDLLEMFRATVQSLGYVAVGAKSGQAAIDCLDTGQKIDLLMTDIVMPGKIGGFELARLMRQRDPALPVIYMSGYTGFTTNEMGEVKAPMLPKPSPPAELSRAIHDALDQTKQKKR